MGRKIVVDFPHVTMEGDGTEIPGLGVFPNGEHEVSDEQVETYLALGNEWDDENEVKEFGYPEQPVVEEPGPEEVEEPTQPLPVEEPEGGDL